MRKIYFSGVFLNDYKFIENYIVENFGEKTKNEFREKINKTVSNLAVFPRMGRGVIMKKEFRFIKGVNWIFYEFNEEEITFLKIINSKQNT